MSVKKFEMPGQTKELDMSAADAEALKIFYSTLHTQRPESEMASKWMLQYGLLEKDEAERLSKLLLKIQKKTPSSGSKPAAKRAVASDDDFKAAPAKKKAATNGKRSAADSSDDEFSAPAAKKPKPAAAKAKPPARPNRAPARQAAADSSDEEDTPLSQRKVGKKAAAKR